MRATVLTLVALFLAAAAPAAHAPVARLAFSGEQGISLLGGRKPRLLRRAAAEPAWLPDGRRLAFVAPRAGEATDL